MHFASIVAAVALSASAPFPAPKVTAVSDDMKFVSGAVASVDAAKGELKVNASAGVVTFHLGASALLVGSNGQATTLAQVRAGMNVYVYYLVQNGAIISELDVQS